MKLLLTLVCCLPLLVHAQVDSTVTTSPPATAPDQALGDTTVYEFAEVAPRFPSPCERYDTTAAALSECAQRFLLQYISERAIYTQEAREQNISGTAVVAFIVERNGLINRPKVVRDPGGGLGQAALNAVYSMQRSLLWRPAFKDGRPVRFRFILPVRFRLEEAKPYVVVGRDTIYTELTRAGEFLDSGGSFSDFVTENLRYPEAGNDSCRTGQLDVQLLIRPGGGVSVQDIIDYNDLGIEFTGAAIDVSTASFGKWRPAEYEGRAVISALDVPMIMLPTKDSCATTAAAYRTALEAAERGSLLVQDSTQYAAGITALTQAVDAFPRDARFRILRGQAQLDANELAEACTDLRIGREESGLDWYDSVLQLICRQPSPEE